MAWNFTETNKAVTDALVELAKSRGVEILRPHGGIGALRINATTDEVEFRFRLDRKMPITACELSGEYLRSLGDYSEHHRRTLVNELDRLLIGGALAMQGELIIEALQPDFSIDWVNNEETLQRMERASIRLMQAVDERRALLTSRPTEGNKKP